MAKKWNGGGRDDLVGRANGTFTPPPVAITC
jgi:putative DNA methylase